MALGGSGQVKVYVVSVRTGREAPRCFEECQWLRFLVAEIRNRVGMLHSTVEDMDGRFFNLDRESWRLDTRKVS